MKIISSCLFFFNFYEHKNLVTFVTEMKEKEYVLSKSK